MKKKQKFLKRYRKDFISLLLLISLSFYAWRFLPTWIIQFQGFMYFIPQTLNTYLGMSFNLLTTAQVAGVLLSAILVKLVGVNMAGYMWIQLVTMMFISILFYLVIRVVTKNRFIAFSSSLIYAVSYFGNYEMYMIDYSAHLLERASINVIFLLLSFMFLHLFLEKTKRKYYLISIVFYFLGVLSSHFSILFTAPYFLYPFFWHLFNRKSILKGFAIGLSYVLVSGFFIYLSSVGTEPVLRNREGFLQFILSAQKYRYPEAMLMQLVYWSQYPSAINSILSGWFPMSYFNYVTAAPLKPLIIVTYVISAFIVYRNLVNKHALLLTAIFGTASIFLFNLYLGRYDPFTSGSTNRYLYFPTYLLAIFWSLFLWVLMKNKNYMLKITAVVLLIGYYFININLLHMQYLRDYTTIRSQKAIFDYITHTRSKQKQNTLITGSYPELAGQYEAPFFTAYLGKGDVKYMVDTFNVTDWRIVATSSSHVIHLKFDTECQCVIEEKIK